MAKLETKVAAAKTISSRVKEFKRRKILGFISLGLVGILTVTGSLYNNKKENSEAGFWASLSGRLALADLSAIPEALIKIIPFNSKEIVTKTKDIAGLSKFNLTTGEHPVKRFKSLIYVGNNKEGSRILVTPKLITAEAYAKYEGIECEKNGNVAQGDLACKSPVSNIEGEDLAYFCKNKYGVSARFPDQSEAQLITKSANFKNNQKFAFWLDDISPDDDDNRKIFYQNSSLNKLDYLDENSKLPYLGAVCVVEVVEAVNTVKRVN